MADIAFSATQVRPASTLYIAEHATAGEALTIGDLVQINASHVAVKTNATTVAGANGTLGIVISGPSGKRNTDGTVASGDEIAVFLFGLLYINSAGLLVETSTLYVSTNAGKIANVAPTFWRVVGTVYSPTTIFFNAAPAAAGS